MNYAELWHKIEPLIPEDTELDQEVKARIFIVLDIAEKNRLERKNENIHKRRTKGNIGKT